MAVLSLVGLACNFVTVESSGSLLGASGAKAKSWNLGTWFDNIGDMDGVDEIGGWLLARWALVATAILLVVMIAMVVIGYFIKPLKKNKIWKWTTFALGIVVAVGAVMFMIGTLVGCDAMSGSVGIEGIASTAITYTASFGVYLFSFGSVASAILSEVVLLRK